MSVRATQVLNLKLGWPFLVIMGLAIYLESLGGNVLLSNYCFDDRK